MTERLTENIRPRGIFILIVTAVLVQMLMQAQSLAVPIAATLVTGALCAFVLVPTGALFPFYLLYLLFEGAVKILSNYNPILHVGSDLVLLATFWRLYQRKNNRPDLVTLDEQTTRDLRVAMVFFALFWVWVAVQFFNPVGIGLLPSLASLKLHLVPYLCFFIVCFLMTEQEVRTLAYWILGLVSFEAVFSLFDWVMGVGFLGSISPRYIITYYSYLRGNEYRPFGTTSLPGQPSVWIGHGFVMLFVVYFQRRELFKTKAQGLVAWVKRWWWAALYPLVGTATLLVCQVRVLLIRAVLLTLAGLAVQGKKHGTVVAIGALLLGIWVTQMPDKEEDDTLARTGMAARLHDVFARIGTLKSASTYQKARGGTWAFEELGRRASVTATGIGLSRVSASSAPWTERIRENRYFNADWGFTDNLILAIFTELGIFGLVAYLTLFLALMTLLVRRPGPLPKLVAFYILLTLLGGYASEGLLYQPEASVFWTIVGMGFRMRQTV